MRRMYRISDSLRTHPLPLTFLTSLTSPTLLSMILSPLIAFVVTVVAYGLGLKLFRSSGLLDFPERYGLKRPRIPYPTGIIPVVIFLAFFITQSTLGMREVGVIISVVLLSVTCFIDDRTPLPSWFRLGVQVIVALIIFSAGSRIYTITHPLGGILKLDTVTLNVPVFGSLPLLSGIVTMGWLLLTINAMNWFDGVSGQVSVVSTLGFLMIGLLAYYRNGEPDIALLAFTLAGIAGAGILFDFPPAKMLMGDSGSMFFGLLLGLLGVYQGGKIATAFLALGIPLTDALFVIIGRMMRKQSPFRGGRDHLHHRLLALGFGERIIVLLTALIGACFGGTALFLSTTGKAVAVIILLSMMAVVSVVLGKKRCTVVREHQ